jgi:3-isopropylmalate/(R)-2-methylmalate dehydratase small subunit
VNPVKHITGRVALYPSRNIDTDQIVPARFLSRERREGYYETLFHDLRFDRRDIERSDFVLNRPEYRKPKIMLTGPNFGCGSSREQAVWAVLDYGIHCVIAPSFGSIFNNALENGLLLVVLPTDTVLAIETEVASAAPCEMAVELESQRVVSPCGVIYHFEFNAYAKRNLIKGLNKIDLTLERRAEIDAFERDYVARFPGIA